MLNRKGKDVSKRDAHRPLIKEGQVRRVRWKTKGLAKATSPGQKRSGVSAALEEREDPFLMLAPWRPDRLDASPVGTHREYPSKFDGLFYFRR